MFFLPKCVFRKKRFFFLRRSIAPKLFVVERRPRRQVYAQNIWPCNAEDRMCLYSPNVFLEFFSQSVSEKKKSTICHIKCCGFLTFEGSRFSLPARDAGMSSAYDGILQPKIAIPENAFPCVQPEGGVGTKMRKNDFELKLRRNGSP